MPGRGYGSTGRYGFDGKEPDKESPVRIVRINGNPMMPSGPGEYFFLRYSFALRSYHPCVYPNMERRRYEGIIKKARRKI